MVQIVALVIGVIVFFKWRKSEVRWKKIVAYGIPVWVFLVIAFLD